MGALHGPAARALDRPDTPGNDEQFNFDPGDVVETFGSPGGDFLIHFTRQGPNAVPAADADGSGTPDFVEQVAGVYDEVIVHYRDALGFRPPESDAAIPDNGGDGRFDVYLVDFAGIGDGAFRTDACGLGGPDVCAGYMVQENDYAGYGYPSALVANRILGSHELFHAVQAAYDAGQGSIMSEGTAVWATESFDPSLNDFEYFIDGYLDNPDRSLDVPLPGPVDPFSYGSAIFFQFLEERYGGGAVRALWERAEDGANGVADPVWFTELDPMLAERAQATFAEAFVDFATWNLFTGSFADPARSYAEGAGYARVKIEEVAAPYSDLLRVFHASAQYYRVPPAGRPSMAAALAPATPEQLDGLSLLLLPEQGGAYGQVARVADLEAGSEAIDTSGADALVVVVVNGAQAGDSRRPTLCIGTPDEVAACKAAAGGTGGGGGGGGGAGGGGDEEAPGEDDGGCGCRVEGAGGGIPGGAAAAAAAAAVGLAARIRGRRRRARIA
ncbi:MAG: hypothetical protein IT372_31865 [Polyangiaceae bacterium]|nr:hypothetical protein [Polyangiaceae bacterium]